MRPFRLPADADVTVNVHGRVRRSPTGLPEVTVTARTPLELTRTAEVGRSRTDFGFSSSNGSC